MPDPVHPTSRKEQIHKEDYLTLKTSFSDPDPGRSKLCNLCEEFIKALHSHPWNDSERAGMGVGLTHLQLGYHAAASRPVYRLIEFKTETQHNCSLCALVHEVLSANIHIWHHGDRLVGLSGTWNYRLEPTLYGRMLDLAPRRGFGQKNQVVKTLHDRWSLGIDVVNFAANKPSTLLPCAIHCSSRPVTKYLRHLTKQTEIPFEHRPIQHGRHRPLRCNIELIKSWPARCESCHGRECHQSSNDRITVRLIDTADDCIVLKDLGSSKKIDYVALSYVWGNISQDYASSAEAYEALHRKGALGKLHLSQTVADAVQLVRELGLRYLWVDALCIQQTSAIDKHDQIAQMGFVYQRAMFTIVAAAGVDCTAGLPGLRWGSRSKEQNLVQAGDFTLMAALQFPGNKILTPETSKWAVRGWTLQEELLSPRQLIFTEEQIWWRCPCAIWCEDAQLETDDHVGFLLKDESVRRRLEDRFSDLKPEQYFELVAIYAKRHLSYPTDALNAFSGILAVLTKYSRKQFLWALMTSDFERQLYWFGKARVRHGTKQEEFPSWSWVSFQGEISFGRYSTYDSVIECFTIHETGSGYQTVRVNSLRRPGNSEYGIETGDKSSVGIADVQATFPDAPLEADFHLFFYTFSARFLLVPQGRLVLPQLATRYAYDKNGQVLGPKPDYGYIVPSPDESELCEMGERECILLGRRSPTSEWDEPHVVVMLIVRTSGIARRIGIADMPEEFWNLSDKSLQLIALG